MKQILLSDYLLQRLETGSGEPRNHQLYLLIREAILGELLVAGTRLPTSRELASELGTARNTVLHAYEQLRAEGYVEARVGSGTYVARSPPDHQPQTGASGLPPLQQRPQATLSHRGRHIVENTRASAQQWGAFMPGVPDIEAFPFALWARLSARQWSQPKARNLTYGWGGGHPDLKRAIARHLGAARAVQCTPEQILVTDGIHQAIHLCVHLLTDVGNRAWVEDPGYWGIRKVLAALGVETVPVPVDREGLAPGPLDMRRPPRLIFVTPSHQYPLGHVMSLARRRMLIEYAERHGAWIVEDDYDSEFRYGGRPLASLQGLEPNAPVLYTGTFSKTMFPGLRLGYMVLPTDLVQPFQLALSDLYREGRWMDQAVMAEFIDQGYYAAHIRRMRLLYGRKRALLRDAVDRHIPQATLLSADSHAGLHLAIGLPEDAMDTEIAQRAQAHGLVSLPLSRYYMRREAARQGLVLGYGGVAEAQIEPMLRRLARLVPGAQPG